MGIRDSQRQRVYTSELVLSADWFNHPFDPDLTKNSVLAAEFLAWMTNDPWFAARWPRLVGKITMVPSNRVHGGYAEWWANRLTVSRQNVSPGMLVHELAHLCAYDGHRNEMLPAHGWEFCSVYLSLVDHYLGTPAARLLRSSFRRHNVRSAPPRKRRALTDDQRVRSAAYLAAARAAKAAAPRFVWERTKAAGSGGRQGDYDFRDVVGGVEVAIRSDNPTAVDFAEMSYAKRMPVTMARKVARSTVEDLARKHPAVTFTVTFSAPLPAWTKRPEVTEAWRGHWKAQDTSDVLAA